MATFRSAGRLRVDLSALTMVPGGMGGTETYFWGLLGAFEADDALDLSVRLPSNATGALPDAVTLRHGPPTQASTVGRLRTSSRLLAGLGIPRPLGAEVIHYPFTVALPRPAAPHVITLHDVQHLALPENFSATERAYRRWAYDKVARRAHAVITVSAFSRGEIVRLLGIPEERVHAIPLGVESAVVPRRIARERFVLYPARRWPHKNHTRLIEAVRELRRTMPDLRLVLTGGGADLADVPEWVEQKGLVSREELLTLYARAGCLAYPSLYEGFGLPPLEAMAAGCPVAVSDQGALPEVCGDVTEVFDPTDVGGMARAIGRALAMPDARIEAAERRAAAFTWRRAAQAHAAIYRQLASSPGLASRRADQ